MKYAVDDFLKEDFERLDRIVRAVILSSGRVEVWNTPRRVTTDSKDLAPAHRSVVARSMSETGDFRGLCFTCTNNPLEFDLWFNPAIVDRYNSNFWATVIHELCHGYLGTQHGHDQVWRRLYARALFHCHHEVHAIDHHVSLVDMANWRYTKRAKSETSAQFLKRINKDRAKWIATGFEQADRVAEIYKRMK